MRSVEASGKKGQADLGKPLLFRFLSVGVSKKKVQSAVKAIRNQAMATKGKETTGSSSVQHIDLHEVKPLKVIVHEAEEGGYWAEVPSLPGCATQGNSLGALWLNIHAAVEGCQYSRAKAMAL